MASIPESKIGPNRSATLRATWRFLSGHHMDGEHRTDAGWLTPGTRHLYGGRVSRWSLLPRAHRAAVRWVTSGAGTAFVWGYLAHRQATEDIGTGVGSVGALAGGYATAQAIAQWRHEREWLRPLHLAVERTLGVPDGTHPRTYLRIPRDYPDREDVGRINLPAAWTGDNRAAVSGIVKEKLGLSDVTISYHLKGRKPYATITQTPRPPARIGFDDVRELVDAAPDSAPLIGIGPRGVRVAIDLDTESPHVMVSASTGGGKSVIARSMTSQALHRGAQAVILDRKRISHKWARGLPNVAYCRDIADIHDALVWLGEEGERRTRIADEWEGDEKDAPVGPRLIVVLEEVNATIGKLKKHWTKIRTKEDDKESPAIEAFGDVLFMGRAVKMHIIAVGQSITVNALGGDPAMRECFGTRILARFTRNMWAMLVPEISPPRMSRHPGRAQVALGGTATETQVAFFTEAETREWAMSGIVAPAPDLTTDTLTPAASPAQTALTPDTAAGEEHPRLTLVKGDAGTVGPRRYTLAEAARESVVPMKYGALRQAKSTDPEFPAGELVDGKQVWTATQLQSWHRNRPGNRTKAGEV